MEMEETLKSIVMALQDLKQSQEVITGRIQGVEDQIKKGSSPTIQPGPSEEELFPQIPMTDIKPKASKRDRESLTKYGDFQEKIRMEEELEQNDQVRVAERQSTMVTEVIVKDEEKYSVISLYTVRAANEKLKMIRKNSLGGKRVKLVHLFARKALDRMVHRQLVLDSVLATVYPTGVSLLEANDMTILQLCADVLRPESIDDYWLKLMK